MNALPQARNDAPGATEAMTDIVFALHGTELDADYRAALWHALCQAAPWLREQPLAGMHALKSAHEAETRTLLLPRRARLQVRVPARDTARALALSGTRLVVGAHALQLGAGHERPLVAANTLYAELVALGTEDEIAFTHELQAALDALAVKAHLICGRARRWHAAADPQWPNLAGFPVALHGLKPEASLRVQCTGIGRGRAWGCGLFVPHKAITGLD
jgi:CRISPR-associated protein Cas6